MAVENSVFRDDSEKKDMTRGRTDAGRSMVKNNVFSSAAGNSRFLTAATGIMASSTTGLWAITPMEWPTISPAASQNLPWARCRQLRRKGLPQLDLHSVLRSSLLAVEDAFPTTFYYLRRKPFLGLLSQTASAPFATSFCLSIPNRFWDRLVETVRDTFTARLCDSVRLFQSVSEPFATSFC
jgi:hypothetical protein